jgi:hypothetical protein
VKAGLFDVYGIAADNTAAAGSEQEGGNQEPNRESVFQAIRKIANEKITVCRASYFEGTVTYRATICFLFRGSCDLRTT